MAKASVRNVEAQGKTALIRVDFNVPLDENGAITDDTRIRAALPTIEYLIAQGAKLILCSHLGRPDGSVVPAMSVKPAADRLSELLGKDVAFVDDCIGDKVANAAAKLQPGYVLVLENTRFHTEETSKDEATVIAFGEKLAAPADFYVNDAFGACHRNHGSTYGATKFLSPCVMGLLVERELASLAQILNAPEKGFITVLGGAKVEDKIGVIKSLLPKCERMLIGGAMSWAFFKAQGKEVGESLCKESSVAAAKTLLESMGDTLEKLVLPIDVNMQNMANPTEYKYASADGIEPGWDAMDIGPETRKLYAEAILAARNVFWNGPMGKFEDKPFDEGTLAVAEAMGACPGYNVVGGGDSVAAVTQMGIADQIDHISTGGGASLEFIENGTLPAVEALDEE